MSGPRRSERLGPPPVPPCRRVVSLVPSLTAALFQLDCGERVAGRTEWCVRPAGAIEKIPAIGGTKSTDVAAVLALEPDLVLANREENVKKHILALAEKVPVLLTDPQSPADVPGLWRELGELLGCPLAAEARAAKIEWALGRMAVADASPRNTPRPTFLYYIWKNPWMVAGHGTYISALLETAGFDNVLPPDKTRFPRLTDDELAGLRPTVHFFSTEPFEFVLPRDLPKSVAAENARLVDAVRLSWYPSHTLDGLAYAAELLKETAHGTARRPHLAPDDS